MDEYQRGESIWETTGVKAIVAAVIILFFGVIFYLQIRPDPETTRNSYRRQPAANNSPRQTLPMPAGDTTSPHSYASEPPSVPYTPYTPDNPPSMPNQPMPPAGVPIRAEIQNPTTAPSPAAPMQPHSLSAPVTQVHSLNNVEEVMGSATSEGGKVGVTQTYRLPDQDGGGANQPLPKNDRQP